MALRRHRLPRYWLGLTLGSVTLLCATAYWWERQLPDRLATAIDDADYVACLHYSRQLAALRWLGQKAPEEQALCRRRGAQEAWKAQRTTEALQLQEKLVNSGVGTPLERRRDLAQLQSWRNQLRNQALETFRSGDIAKALELLKPVESSLSPAGSRLSDSLNETWKRNQLDHQRLAELVKAKRWWEALAVMNRLDHPWWQQRSLALRRTVETAIDALKDQQEHQNHGDLPSHSVPNAQLNQAVQQRIAQGMEPWKAFETGCQDVGGHVVEEGPESLCKRR